MTPNPANPDSVSILQFGGEGNGAATAAGDTQALAAAAAFLKGQNGAGEIIIPCRPFAFTPGYTLPDGINLRGSKKGPFDPYMPPLTPATTFAPTLLCMDPSAPFLTTGVDGRIDDVQIYCPNQVGGLNANKPVPYPATVTLGSTGGVSGLTLINSYFGINVLIGRTSIERCKIGSLAVGIRCEEVSDVVIISDVRDGVFYTTVEGAAGPSPSNLAHWALCNGIAYDIARADGLLMDNITTFWKQVGIRFRDTTNAPLPGDNLVGNPTSGYAKMSILDFDTVQYGAVLTSTNNTGGGVKASLWDIGSCNTIEGWAGVAGGQAALYCAAGGNFAPELVAIGGSVRGTWAYGPKVCTAGKLATSGMRGIDI